MSSAKEYLRSTAYIDAEHPRVVETARRITEGATTEIERLGRIYHHVRDLPYDILASFRYLAQGQTAASDVLEHGVAFCMGKASSFVALSRAAGIPARVAFQALDAPKMEFLSPEVRVLWGGPVGRPLPWHSLGEAFINGRWVKLDATIDAPTATKLGKPYTVAFDGRTDIPTVEGPVLRENGSYTDYPAEVADWYLHLAREVRTALESSAAHDRVANDDVLWSGPDPELVRRRAVA